MNVSVAPSSRRPWHVFVSVEIFVGTYLTVIFVKNFWCAPCDIPGWRSDVVRAAGWFAVAFVFLLLGAILMSIAWWLRLRRATDVLSGQLILGIVLLELVGIHHAHQLQLLKRSMATLRDTASDIHHQRRGPDGSLPERFPASTEAPVLDAWGNRIFYQRVSPTEAFLISTGSDGWLEFRPELLKDPDSGYKYPPGRFERDVVVHFSPAGYTFVRFMEGNAQGDGCVVSSMFGCFSYSF